MASPNGVSAPHPDHTLLIFDLDNCLYPHSCGIGPTMSKNLLKFCLDLGMTEEETRRRCWNWYRAYGMSLHGLMDEHEVDVEEFDRRVDLAVPVPDLLPKELPAVLSDVLDRLKDYRKTIFTNAQRPHAERVLSELGIRHHFETITSCDYSQRWFVAKPEGGAYIQAMQDAGVLERWHREHLGEVSDFNQDERLQIYFFDDNLENCEVASSRFGWHAVHIDEPDRAPPHHFGSQYSSGFRPELHATPEHVVEKARVKKQRNDTCHPSIPQGREGKLVKIGYVHDIGIAVPELFVLSGGPPTLKLKDIAVAEELVVDDVEGEETEEEMMRRAEEEGVEVTGGGLSR